MHPVFRKLLRRPLVAFAPLAAVLLLTGCQATGAGTVPSSCLWDATQARYPSLKNTPAGFLMAFKADNTLDALVLGVNASWSGTYVDPCAGVAFRVTGQMSRLERTAGHPTGGWAGTFVTTYVSTVPSKPGAARSACLPGIRALARATWSRCRSSMARSPATPTASARPTAASWGCRSHAATSPSSTRRSHKPAHEK